jgi:hypothetical protein
MYQTTWYHSKEDRYLNIQSRDILKFFFKISGFYGGILKMETEVPSKGATCHKTSYETNIFMVIISAFKITSVNEILQIIYSIDL